MVSALVAATIETKEFHNKPRPGMFRLATKAVPGWSGPRTPALGVSLLCVRLPSSETLMDGASHTFVGGRLLPLTSALLEQYVIDTTPTAYFRNKNSLWTHFWGDLYFKI